MNALFWICVLLVFAAANTLLSWLLPGATVIGPSLRSLRPLFGLFWLVLIFGFLVPAMRRFRSPLGDIVEAADRVCGRRLFGSARPSTDRGGCAPSLTPSTA